MLLSGFRTMKNNRTFMICGGVFLLLLLWLVWPGGNGRLGGPHPDHPEPSAQASRPREVAGDRTYGADSLVHRGFRAHRGSGSNSTGDAAMRQINYLLSDSSLEDAYCVQRLRDIAGDTRVSNSVRLEAMAHGVLLSVGDFADLAAQPSLPDDLASALLGQVINANDNPAMQIEVYLNLLKHPSAEIHQEALSMLRFMMEDDFEEADIDSLIIMAKKKLTRLAALPEN